MITLISALDCAYVHSTFRISTAKDNGNR